MHGSGFVFCSLRSHRGLVARVSQATGLPVFSLDYGLAPEHVFPAAHDDVLAAYRWLLGEGYAPERIVVAGDSAGAHLSVALAVELRRLGLPQPGSLVLLSPYLDPSWQLAFERDKERSDPFFFPEAGRRCVNLYFGGADPRDPRIDLINIDATGLPPMLLQVGGSECFSAAAEVFAARVNAAGGACDLQVWPGQIHVFQATFRLIPEANMALAQIGSFVRTVLADSLPPFAPRWAA
jgi:acetyl esterase/lipase